MPTVSPSPGARFRVFRSALIELPFPRARLRLCVCVCARYARACTLALSKGTAPRARALRQRLYIGPLRSRLRAPSLWIALKLSLRRATGGGGFRGREGGRRREELYAAFARCRVSLRPRLSIGPLQAPALVVWPFPRARFRPCVRLLC